MDTNLNTLNQQNLQPPLLAICSTSIFFFRQNIPAPMDTIWIVLYLTKQHMLILEMNSFVSLIVVQSLALPLTDPTLHLQSSPHRLHILHLQISQPKTIDCFYLMNYVIKIHHIGLLISFRYFF